MTRRFPTLILTLICIALAAMWARSLWRHDRVFVTSTRQVAGQWTGTQIRLRSLHGGVSLEHTRVEFASRNPPPIEYRGKVRGPEWYSSPTGHTLFGPPGGSLRWVGIAVYNEPIVLHSPTGSVDGSGSTTTVVLPYWLLVLIAGTAPALRALANARRRYRQEFQPGLCRACGYDLRASSERCPECGEPIHASTPGGPAS